MIKDLNKLEHIKLVRRLAWSYNFTTGIDFLELHSEALLAYAEALNSYNPDKGTKFITHLHTVINNVLRDFIKENYKVKSTLTYCNGMTDELTDDWKHGTYQTHKFEIDDMFNGKAKEVVNTILTHLDEFDFNKAPKLCRGQITKYFIEKGWSRAGIYGMMKEIRVQVANN